MVARDEVETQLIVVRDENAAAVEQNTLAVLAPGQGEVWVTSIAAR